MSHNFHWKADEEREFTLLTRKEEYEKLLKSDSLKGREGSNTCREGYGPLCFEADFTNSCCCQLYFTVYVNLRYQFNEVKDVYSVTETVKLYVFCNIYLIFLSTFSLIGFSNYTLRPFGELIGWGYT